jgi:2-oxoglutarate ferredoxin oxidoreductase subunit beta
MAFLADELEDIIDAALDGTLAEKESDKVNSPARGSYEQERRGPGSDVHDDLMGTDLGLTPGVEDRRGADHREPQKAKDFTSDQEVRWCPGCGDYVILNTIRNFLPELGTPPGEHRVRQRHRLLEPVPVLPGDLRLPLDPRPGPDRRHRPGAGPPDLSVWVVTGDGDALSIGGNHLIHALRRNVNLTILLFNNRIYGLTKGQYSPTSEVGKVTKSTPMGSLDHPFNPVSLALGAEATFVGRALDSDRKGLTEVLRAAAEHRGAAIVRSCRTARSSTTARSTCCARRAPRAGHQGDSRASRSSSATTVSTSCNPASGWTWPRPPTCRPSRSWCTTRPSTTRPTRSRCRG